MASAGARLVRGSPISDRLRTAVSSGERRAGGTTAGPGRPVRWPRPPGPARCLARRQPSPDASRCTAAPMPHTAAWAAPRAGRCAPRARRGASPPRAVTPRRCPDHTPGSAGPRPVPRGGPRRARRPPRPRLQGDPCPGDGPQSAWTSPRCRRPPAPRPPPRRLRRPPPLPAPRPHRPSGQPPRSRAPPPQAPVASGPAPLCHTARSAAAADAATPPAGPRAPRKTAGSPAPPPQRPLHATRADAPGRSGPPLRQHAAGDVGGLLHDPSRVGSARGAPHATPSRLACTSHDVPGTSAPSRPPTDGDDVPPWPTAACAWRCGGVKGAPTHVGQAGARVRNAALHPASWPACPG